MKRLFLALLIFLVGCAAPSHIKKNAESVLKGKCLDIFLDGTPNRSYQYAAQSPAAGNPVLALIILEDGNQVCSYANDLWDLDLDSKGRDDICWTTCQPWEEIEAIALAKCEALKKQMYPNTKKRCEIYARGNEIVWGKNKGEIEFQ